MTTRTENLRLIISGDGRLLGAELNKTDRQLTTFANRATKMFTNAEQKILGSVKNLATNPLTLIGGVAGVLYEGKKLVDFQDNLSTLGINAGMTAKQIYELNQMIYETAYATGQDRDVLTSAINDIIDKTGDVPFAIAALKGTGIASTAMGADLLDTSKVLSAFRLGMKATAEESMTMFDIMARMGNVGSFTFKQQAKVAERLFSSAALAVGINKDNFAEYNAFLQTIKPIFGSEEMAATAVEQIMMRLNIDKNKVQKKLGFKLFDEKGSIVDFKKTIEAISKLTTKEQSDLFGESSKAFLPLGDKKGIDQYEMIIRKGTEAGFINEAFVKKTQEAKFQLNAFVTSGKELSQLALTDVLKEVTKYMKEITSDPERLKQFRMELTEIANALSVIAKLGFNLLTLPGDITGKSLRSKLTKQAVEEVKGMPKEEQKKVRSMVGSGWDNGIYNALQKYKNEKANVQLSQTITVIAPEGTKTSTQTTVNGGTASVKTSKRGAFD